MQAAVFLPPVRSGEGAAGTDAQGVLAPAWAGINEKENVMKRCKKHNRTSCSTCKASSSGSSGGSDYEWTDSGYSGSTYDSGSSSSSSDSGSSSSSDSGGC